jgi:hypothetical protein
VNVFFGNAACVAVVRRIGCENLSRLSPEHDFMLGIMLGYDRIKQCDRYLQRSRAADGGARHTTPREAPFVERMIA